MSRTHLRTHRARHTTARFVLVVMVLAALLPGLSRARAWALDRAAPWSVVCSAAAQTAGQAPANDGGGGWQHLGQHCAACHLQQDLLAPPASPSTWQVLLSPTQPQPMLRGRAPGLPPVWRAAQPRAPPLIA